MLATLVSAIYKFNQEEDLSLAALLSGPITHPNAITKSQDLTGIDLAEFDLTHISEEKRDLLKIIGSLMEHVKTVSEGVTMLSRANTANTSQVEFEGIIQTMKGGMCYSKI